MDQTKRIAMWSGPRNLSTAMMYSFGGRKDSTVVDEPFYAAYLAKTGIVHPMQNEILASQFQDPDMVARQLLAPTDRPIFYQKHMTQHMVDGVPRAWMAHVTNVFLIRHPARVVASYAKKREGPQLDDIGFRQQAELFDHVTALGQTPIVVDSHDIRDDPAGHDAQAVRCGGSGVGCGDVASGQVAATPVMASGRRTGMGLFTALPVLRMQRAICPALEPRLCRGSGASHAVLRQACGCKVVVTF